MTRSNRTAPLPLAPDALAVLPVRVGKPPTPATPTRPADILGIEPALTIDDVCTVRNESRRTGERERSAGLWPEPDFYVGTGSRKSPRWWPETIVGWLERERERSPRR
jgi:hypothetical protein